MKKIIFVLIIIAAAVLLYPRAVQKGEISNSAEKITEKEISSVSSAVQKTKEIKVFFGNNAAAVSGKSGKYGFVLPVKRKIKYDDEEGIIKLTLLALIKGPLPEEKEYYPALSSETKILNMELKDGTLFIDFSKEIWRGAGGTLGTTVLSESILFTLGQFDGVNSAVVLVEGDFYEDGHIIWDEPRLVKNLDKN